MEISAQKARHLILHLQGLTKPPHLRLTQDQLLSKITELGFVQVDSIQWVERAHHMILFARNQTYRPRHLKKLKEHQAALFENWTHDASIIPTEFFPYWRHKFDRDREKLKRQFHNWQGKGYLEHVEGLRTKIQNEGELRARDLEKPKSTKLEMWQWHDGKSALEYMLRTGELCISKRERFQKVYDLTDRVLSPEILEKTVSSSEFQNWACRSALDRLGFGTPKDIAAFWNLLSIDEVKNWLSDQNGQSVRTVTVQGKKKGTAKEFFARPDIEDVIETLPSLPPRMRVLSPFDPVIRDRNRLEWLFGYNYRIEIYVPEAKRQYGYYVFPLLDADTLIGRIDMRANRKSNSIEVKALWLEPGVKWSNARQSRLDAELLRQTRLTNLKNVSWLDGAKQF